MTLLRRFCPWIMHPLVIVLLIGGGLRVASWSVNAPNMRWQNDARMSIPAVRILEGKGLSLADQTGPTAYRPPLYILWLSGAYALFGPFSTYGPSFLQIVGSTLNIALLYALALQVWKRRDAAIASAGLLAVHPYAVYHDPALYHTFLSTALLLGGMTLLLTSLKTQKLSRCVLSGMCFGACVLLMSTIVPFLGLCTVGIILLWRQSIRIRLSFTFAFLAGVMLLWSPWIIRNAIAFRAFVPLTTEAGVTLWMGNNPEASWRLPLREHESSPVPRGTRFAIPEQYTGCPPNWCKGGISEIQENAELSTLAREWIRAHPSAFLRLTAWRMANIWSPFLTPEKSFGSRSITVLIQYGYALWNVLLGVFILVGTWILIRERRWAAPLLVWSLALSSTAGYALFLYYTKYRIPFESVLLLLAGPSLVRTFMLMRAHVFHPTIHENAAPSFASAAADVASSRDDN